MRRLVPLLAAALLVLPGPALAALRVPAPPGWDRGSMVPPQTLADATELAQASGAELIDVFAGPEDDDYIESVVVMERNEPLDAEALRDPEAARALAQSWIAPWAPSPEDLTVELVARGKTQAIEVTFRTQNIAWLVLIAPTGPTTGAVVVRGQASELPLYRRTFQEVLDSAQGLAPPVTPVRRSRARAIAGGLWLAGAGGAFGIGLATAPIARDLRFAARRAALVLAISSVVVTMVLLGVFWGRADALLASGTTPIALSLELGAYGVVMAVLAGAFALFGPEPTKIQSAPDTGLLIPATAPGQLRPSTEPSRLEPAHQKMTIPPNATIEVPSAQDVALAAEQGEAET